MYTVVEPLMNKGPMPLEETYAMKLLRDHGVKLNKRFRLIMGCKRRHNILHIYGTLQSGSRRAFLRFRAGCQLPVYPR
ncbi:MAG: hypothetical protein V8Q93_08205 [Blautia faecis]